MKMQLLSYVLVALVSIFTGVLVGSAGLLQQNALAQGGCKSFQETGRTVCGKFLIYWQQHGGLAQQGLPISSEFTEVSDLDGKPYTVQYFERAMFELHPEQKPPYDVELSQLGTFRLHEKYPNGAPNQQPTAVPVSTGAIEGDEGYPSSGVPASYIFAVGLDNNRHYYTRTENSLGFRPAYRIDGIEPGIYNVVARPVSPLIGADPSCGGYSQFVACGQTVTCYDHSLIPITVVAGQTVRGVAVEDWYAGTAFCPLIEDLP